MALQKVNVPVNFTEGVDTKTNKFLAGKHEALENVHHEGDGTIKKRGGQRLLAGDVIGGGSISNVVHAFNLNNELLINTTSGTFSWAEQIDKWKKVGRASPCSFDYETASASLDIRSTSHGENANYRYVAINYASNVLICVYDIVTKTAISDISFGSTFKAYAVTWGARAGFLTVDSATGNVAYREYDSATNTFTSTALTGGAGAPYLEWATDGSQLLVLYSDSTGANIEVDFLSSSLVLSNSSITVTWPAGETIRANIVATYDATLDNWFFVVGRNNAGTREHYYYRFDDSFSVVAGPTQISSDTPIVTHNPACCVVDGDTFYYFYTRVFTLAGIQYREIFQAVLTISTTAVGATTSFQRLSSVSSKAFFINGIAYFLASSSVGSVSLSQESCYLVSIAGDVVGRFFEGETREIGEVGVWSDLVQVPQPVISGNEISIAAQLVKTQIDDAFTRFQTSRSVTAICKFNFKDLNIGYPQDIGGELAIPGAIVKTYDGDIIREKNFNHWPVINQITFNAGALTGTFLYKVVYRFINKNGEETISSPSQALVATPAAQDVLVQYLNYQIGDNTAAIRVHIYRTENNGTVYYEVTPAEGIANDPTMITSTHTDTVLDAALVDNKPAYFNGDVLENDAPRPTRSITNFKSRYASVNSDRPDELEYSKTYTPQIRPENSRFLTIRADDKEYHGAEKVRATMILDDKIIIFKDRTILFTQGDGANNAGAQNSLFFPEVISTNVGTVNPRSIILSPNGIFFKSEKGIYLLGRDLNISYIGADVEEHNGENITGAVLMKNINQIRFTTENGVCLVYDYFFRQWSWYTNHQANGSTFWNGEYVRVNNSAQVFVSKNDRDDDGAFIQQKIKTNWLKVQGIQDFARVYRLLLLGEYVSNHTITLNVYYDYQDYAWDSYTLTPQDASKYNVTSKPTDDDFDGGLDGTFQWKVHLIKQKCQAIKFEIIDNYVDTNGESFRLSNMTLQLGVKKGPFKTPAIKQA